MHDYSTDLFISYAHIDNQPLPAIEEGWICRFHETLEAYLDMRLGEEAQVWRDEKLQGNDHFANELIVKFEDTAVLVSVLTPRYLNSEWCTREAHEFCRQAEKHGGLFVGNKARIFKVLKTPVESEEGLPEAMRKLLGYEFFTMVDGRPLEIDPEYGKEFAGTYHQKVNALAWDISELLKVLEGETGPIAAESETKDGLTVYLAECSYDRRDARQTIEFELKRHGYTVLPDQKLPRVEDDFIETVEDLIKRCDLSIHLVGPSYGAVPDGPSDTSIVVLQNQIAAKRSGEEGLARIIWLPDGTETEHRRQQAFISDLHNNSEVQKGADLITADLEDVKAAIHNTLNRMKDPEPAAAPAVAESTGARHVYLICDERDRSAVLPIRKFLRGQGLEVSIPAFQGDAAEVRDVHQQLMANCDAVALYYGAGDEAWKRTLVNEMKKMQGYRGGKPLLAKFTILASPVTADKEELVFLEEPDLINILDAYSDDALAPLITALRA